MAIWAVVEYEWCTECGERAVGEGMMRCVMCEAERSAP